MRTCLASLLGISLGFRTVPGVLCDDYAQMFLRKCLLSLELLVENQPRFMHVAILRHKIPDILTSSRRREDSISSLS